MQQPKQQPGRHKNLCLCLWSSTAFTETFVSFMEEKLHSTSSKGMMKSLAEKLYGHQARNTILLELDN